MFDDPGRISLVDNVAMNLKPAMIMGVYVYIYTPIIITIIMFIYYIYSKHIVIIVSICALIYIITICLYEFWYDVLDVLDNRSISP